MKEFLKNQLILLGVVGYIIAVLLGCVLLTEYVHAIAGFAFAMWAVGTLGIIMTRE